MGKQIFMNNVRNNLLAAVSPQFSTLIFVQFDY